jgi:hypothetical protein
MEGACIERRGQGSHLVEKNTKGPDIRLEAVALTLDDLRGEVVGGSYDGLGLGARVGKDTGDSEVTQLDDSIFVDKDVLTLKITMQNLFVVAMLNGEGDLGEPVQKLILGHIVLAALAVDCLEALLNFALKITIICVVHYDAQLALFGFVDFPETHDIGVVKHLQNLGLVQGLTSLFLAHLCDVNLLNHSKRVV